MKREEVEEKVKGADGREVLIKWDRGNGQLETRLKPEFKLGDERLSGGMPAGSILEVPYSTIKAIDYASGEPQSKSF